MCPFIKKGHEENKKEKKLPSIKNINKTIKPKCIKNHQIKQPLSKNRVIRDALMLIYRCFKNAYLKIHSIPGNLFIQIKMDKPKQFSACPV